MITKNLFSVVMLTLLMLFSFEILIPKTAEAANCGGNNQRPCNIWERIPSCNKGLYEDFRAKKCRVNKKKKLNCGALNQRPCNVWERIPSCNKGLVENLLAHRCVQGSGSVGSDIKRNAEAVLRDSATILSTMGGYLACFDKRLLEQAISKKDAAYAKKLQNSHCVKRMGGIAYSQGYNTLTVGISGGGSFIIGGFLDTGFAFDTKGRRNPTLYQTKAINVGIQAGGGAGVNIGLYKGSNAVDARGSDTQGFSFEAGAGAGGGTGIWYDYNGKLDGISVSAIVGASGKAGSYNRVTTSYYNLSGPTYINCGAKDQRACKVWERVPSCNKGLYEQLPQGICRAKTALRCGGLNQRACKVWERVPSCNRGLYEKFPTGMCRAKAKPKPKPRLQCGARNQRPCKLWERVPSCNHGLKEHIFKGRCLK